MPLTSYNAGLIVFAAHKNSSWAILRSGKVVSRNAKGQYKYAEDNERVVVFTASFLDDSSLPKIVKTVLSPESVGFTCIAMKGRERWLVNGKLFA